MADRLPADKSNGYEQLAELFMRVRNKGIGPATVREWSRSLAPGSSVLDLGCGSGVPISEVLIEAGFDVYGVDASETMIQAFRQRFPQAYAECSPVEDSPLFDRDFASVVAWGLIFLLPADLQAGLIRKVAKALQPGGCFLFTAPREPVRWNDAITERESISLGVETYERLLNAEGLAIVGHEVDEGENFYYFCQKGLGKL